MVVELFRILVIIIYLFTCLEQKLCFFAKIMYFFHLQEGATGGVGIYLIFHVAGVSIKVDVVKQLEWDFKMNMTLITHTPTFMGDILLHEVI